MSENLVFTAKQKEILRWISLGLTHDEIAAKVFMSKFTIDDYVARMRDQLDCPNTVSLIAMAIRKGVIP